MPVEHIHTFHPQQCQGLNSVLPIFNMTVPTHEPNTWDNMDSRTFLSFDSLV